MVEEHVERDDEVRIIAQRWAELRDFEVLLGDGLEKRVGAVGLGRDHGRVDDLRPCEVGSDRGLRAGHVRADELLDEDEHGGAQAVGVSVELVGEMAVRDDPTES